MAEAVAVISVIASVVQLVDASYKVVHRLEEYRAKAGEIPKSLRHIKTELPLLSATLLQLKEAIEAGSVTDAVEKALLPVVAGCQEQISQLDVILLKTLPTFEDGWREKSKKAIVSLHNDTKVETIMRILHNYVDALTFYYAAASSTIKPLTDEKLSKIRTWLSGPDPSTNYEKARKQRQANTGKWFINSERFIEWKTNPSSPIWLYGIPGCGKSILCSGVLEDIQQYCRDDPGKSIAYFFFDFNDTTKQDPELMLRSLICQLLHQVVKIPESLDDLFSSCDKGQRQPSVKALQELLRDLIQNFPQVYIILDALDECTRREDLMDMLETVLAWKLQNLHFLVTSRKEREIEVVLEEIVDLQSRVGLQSQLVDEDIKQYVRKRLIEDKGLQKWTKDEMIKQEIEDTLMQGAQGMFRWAVCQLDTLGKCRNRAMLRKSLATLPPTLDQTYHRILCAISDEDSDYAMRILQWLSARPMYVEEIAEAVAIDTARDPAFDRDEVLEDPFEALNICSSLVTVMDEDLKKNSFAEYLVPRQIIVLAHYSVQEYLLSSRLNLGRALKYKMDIRGFMIQ